MKDIPACHSGFLLLHLTVSYDHQDVKPVPTFHHVSGQRSSLLLQNFYLKWMIIVLGY